MRYFIRCILLLTSTVLALSGYAQDIERKLVIEDGLVRFFTIDEETQLAHLHTVAISQPLSAADDYIIPTGRHSEDPLNPLCFSLNKDQLITINWILNSNNSRQEAIKKVDLSNWRSRRADWGVSEWGEASFIQPSVAPNEPWERMLQDNNNLLYPFFDLICEDSTRMMMAVCNQNKMRIARWNGAQWTFSAPIPVSFTQYFSLMMSGRTIALAAADGTLYRYDAAHNRMKLVQKGKEHMGLLIEDKDSGKYYIIGKQALEAGAHLPFHTVMQESARELVF